jgi:hypothetical protein
MHPSEMVSLYTQKHMTMRKIAAVAGVSAAWVCQCLHAAGIKREDGTQVTCLCDSCGSTFSRLRSRARAKRLFCSDACYSEYLRSPGYVQSRQGQRNARKAVASIYGPLPSGSVVHHEDGNDHNIEITNLKLFASHSDHMRYHHGGHVEPLWP